ncbi:MAG: GNAT family N-acetyltransferase [Elusimicrobiota bacterium]|nr:MAG: GNAT family N-acetyltransferase [Elusimicrobiota bacterium]
MRPYAEGDRAFSVAFLGDAEVFKHAAGGHLSPERASALFDKIAPIYREGRFAIWLVEEGGRPVGHAELKPRAGEEGLELVYFLAREAQGRGLGTELVGALVRHGLTETKRLLATVHPDNARSVKVLEKAGFAFLRREEHEDGATLYFERR